MVAKRTGITRDLLIHPGETIADILEERNITQAELATRVGVTPAYVSNVISGKKDISAKFAFALEYALGVPKSFWLNLQANYDAQLLELNEAQTITEEEQIARDELKEVVKYLREAEQMPARENKDASILSLRKALHISNISKLKDLIPSGIFRISSKVKVNPYVMGAWLQLCQISADDSTISTKFNPQKLSKLVRSLKQVMQDNKTNPQQALSEIMAENGIDFLILKNFKGAPVQGYLSLKTDGSYHMVITLRGARADIFWFSLFHELGHIVNGDIGKKSKYLDNGGNQKEERLADVFARDQLLDPIAYKKFIDAGDFSIEAIKKLADEQMVMPYIVIGRLQKEGKLTYSAFSSYITKYTWFK